MSGVWDPAFAGAFGNGTSSGAFAASFSSEFDVAQTSSNPIPFPGQRWSTGHNGSVLRSQSDVYGAYALRNQKGVASTGREPFLTRPPARSHLVGIHSQSWVYINKAAQLPPPTRPPFTYPVLPIRQTHFNNGWVNSSRHLLLLVGLTSERQAVYSTPPRQRQPQYPDPPSSLRLLPVGNPFVQRVMDVPRGPLPRPVHLTTVISQPSILQQLVSLTTMREPAITRSPAKRHPQFSFTRMPIVDNVPHALVSSLDTVLQKAGTTRAFMDSSVLRLESDRTASRTVFVRRER